MTLCRDDQPHRYARSPAADERDEPARCVVCRRVEPACSLCEERGIEYPSHPVRRTVHHGGKGSVHLEGDYCPTCDSVRRVIAGESHTGPYVLLEVVTVHMHGCAATRLGKMSGPCDCGGWGLWESNRERAVGLVYGAES